MNAMRQGAAPLHIADPYPLGGIIDRFQSIPDMFLSPQIILLRWLDILPFLMLNFLLLYGVGFAGLLWLGRKLRISLLGLTALFLLFNFNGHLVAHFAEGHYTWIACFLFPWLIGLVIDLINGAGGWRWVPRLSLLMFVILLPGHLGICPVCGPGGRGLSGLVWRGTRLSAARMGLMAMLLVLTLAVTEFQHWLDALAAADRQAVAARAPRWLPGVLLGCFMALGLLFQDLWQNLYLWRIPVAAAAFGVSAFDAQHWAVTNHPDAAYLNLLILGAAVSLAALLVMLYFNRKR